MVAFDLNGNMASEYGTLALGAILGLHRVLRNPLGARCPPTVVLFGDSMSPEMFDMSLRGCCRFR